MNFHRRCPYQILNSPVSCSFLFLTQIQMHKLFASHTNKYYITLSEKNNNYILLSLHNKSRNHVSVINSGLIALFFMQQVIILVFERQPGAGDNSPNIILFYNSAGHVIVINNLEMIPPLFIYKICILIKIIKLTFSNSTA